MNYLTILLQAEGGGMDLWLMMGAIMVVFYFFMIRPQAKKAKEARNFRESLSKGAKVVTIGGIHGKVSEVKDTAVLLDVGGGMKIKVEKSAISSDSSGVMDEQTAKQAASA